MIYANLLTIKNAEKVKELAGHRVTEERCVAVADAVDWERARKLLTPGEQAEYDRACAAAFGRLIELRRPGLDVVLND